MKFLEILSGCKTRGYCPMQTTLMCDALDLDILHYYIKKVKRRKRPWIFQAGYGPYWHAA